MSLRDRLRRMEQRAAAGAAARERRLRDASSSRPPEERVARAGHVVRERVPVPVEIETERFDGVPVRRSRFGLDQAHGDFQLGEIRRAAPERLALLGDLDGDVGPSNAVFLDTETTALGGGGGVYVFLVGLLFVEENHAVVEQILLPGPEREEPFLDLVERRVGSRSHLISFFGKSFDRHRLDDRYAISRGTRPLGDRPHLDLYHAGRRLFGRRLKNGRLQTFERKLLGVERSDDLGGAECPEAYLDFLDGLDDGRMERVFRHNLINVLSLLTLAVLLERTLANPADARESAAAGLLLARAGRDAEAEAHLSQVMAPLVPDCFVLPPEIRQAALTLATLRRRRHDPEGALTVLDRLAAALPTDPEPCLEAAKIAEHGLKDLERARSQARELERRLRESSGGSRHAELLQQARHRLERIERRLSGRA